MPSEYTGEVTPFDSSGATPYEGDVTPSTQLGATPYDGPVTPFQSDNEDQVSRAVAQTPQPPRSAFEAVKDVGSQIAGGAVIDTRKMLGDTMKWLAFNPEMERKGQQFVDEAAQIAKDNPEMTPQTGYGVGGNVVQGIARLAPLIATGAAAAVLLPEVAATSLHAAITSAFVASQGQSTKDKVRAVGGSEDDAEKAGLISAGISAVFFSLIPGLMAPKAASVVAPSASETLGAAVSTGMAKPIATSAGRAVGSGAALGAQAGGVAATESAYGVDANPWDAALEGAVMGMALAAPGAVLGSTRAVNRALENGKIKSALLDSEAPDQVRAAAAAGVGAKIWDVSPEAATNFMRNAADAILRSRAVDISAESFKAPRESQIFDNIGETQERKALTDQSPPTLTDVRPTALPSPKDTLLGGRDVAPNLEPEPGRMPLVDAHAQQNAADNAAAVQLARISEDQRLASVGAPNASRLTAETADKLKIDPNDVEGSLARIAAAPVTPVSVTRLAAPAVNVAPEVHSALAGDMASLMLELNSRKTQFATTPKSDVETRDMEQTKINQVSEQLRQLDASNKSRFGDDGASRIANLAAQTFHDNKASFSMPKPVGAQNGNNNVRSGGTAVNVDNTGSISAGNANPNKNSASSAPSQAGAVQGQPALAGNRQLPQVTSEAKNAIQERSPTEMGAHVGGAEVPGRTTESSGVGSGQQGQEIAGANQAKSASQGNSELGNIERPPTHVFITSAPQGGYNASIGSNAKGNKLVLFPDKAGKYYWGKPASWQAKFPTTEEARVAGKATPQHVTAPSGAEVATRIGNVAEKPATVRIEELKGAALDKEVAAREAQHTTEEAPPKPTGGKPFAAAIAKTQFGPVNLSEIDHGIARKLVSKPAFESSTYPMAPVPPELVRTLAGAIKSVNDIGVPTWLLNGLDGFHSYSGGTTDAIVLSRPSGERSLAFDENVLRNAKSGGEWNVGVQHLLAHEIGHLVAFNAKDPTGPDLSALSRSFEMTPSKGENHGRPVGSALVEAYQAWQNGGELGDYLKYPFRLLEVRTALEITDNTIPEEVFAQSFALYHLNPKLMQEKLPIGYEIQKRLDNVLRNNQENGRGIAGAVAEVLREIPEKSAGVGDVGKAESIRPSQSGVGSGVGENPERVGKPRQSPGVDKAVLHAMEGLTAEERADLTTRTAGTFVAWFSKLPSIQNYAAIAYAGRAKRGWYDSSAKALVSVFGTDAPRFAALLASLSPQSSVESNLENTLRVWKAWTADGRPQGSSKIRTLMSDNVIKKDASSPGSLPSWENNAVRSLTHPDPGSLVISGPKVNSFFANLVGVTHEVTNDGWMAAFARVDKLLLGGNLQAGEKLQLDNSGKAPVYLAMSAKTRIAARVLSKLTGETWTPAQVQETIWSWAKALSDYTDKRRTQGERVTATEIINNRELTDKLINAVPDFSGLLLEPKNAAILKQSGYEGQLEHLDRHRDEFARAKDESRSRLDSQAPPFDRATQLRHEVAAARRIDLKREEPLVPETKVVPGEFQANPAAALKRPGWAILTATVGDHTTRANRAANAALRQRLVEAGVKFDEVEGYYRGASDGKSFIIYQQDASKNGNKPLYARESDAVRLARELGQETALVNKGYIRTADNMLLPADIKHPYVGAAAKERDGYTVMKDGTTFSVNLPEWKDENFITLRDYNLWKQEDQSMSEKKVKLPPKKSEAWEVGRESRSNLDRENVVDSTELKGDGRGFTDFFSAASRGERVPNGKTYQPVIDISSIKKFSDEYVKHRGNFDDHIATSIPGFRDVQQAVGDAIVKTYGDGAELLDIAASEGAFNKAITKLSDGRIHTLALDPNLTMAKFFAEHSQVPNANYEVAAFGSAEDAGKLAWTENEGKADETPVHTFAPQKTYDVVHESMGFQFISNTRNAQFARVKELMKPDGVALFEEKVKEDSARWRANEAQKDEYKSRYFTPDQMKAKAAEVLTKGEAATKEVDSQKEQAVVGMNDLMTTGHEFETALTNNWRYVAQYWDAGNFKGYIASDSKPAVDAFLGNLLNLNSEYSTAKTPRFIGPEKAQAARTRTAAQTQALKDVGIIPQKKTWADRYAAFKQDLDTRVITQTIDSFHPLKALDPTNEAWELAMLSRATAGQVEAVMRYGKNIELIDGVLSATPGGKGFRDTLKDLAGEDVDWLAWVAANRAEQLMADNREHLFTKQNILDLKDNSQGWMDDGRNRAQVYRTALDEMNAINSKILDIAEQSGLIDGNSRHTWERDFYLPFYRVLEEDPTQTANIGGSRGLVGQKAFHMLKGGTDKLSADLLGNIERNWAHLFEASARNRAAKPALEAAERMGVAVEVPVAEKGSKWFLEGGAKRHFVVHDPLTMIAISSLENLVDGKWMKVLSAPKRAITMGATADPSYVIRNAVRDTITAVAVSDISLNIGKNVATGLAMAANKNNPIHAAALAGGGIIHFGQMTDGKEADHYARLVREGTQPWTILNSPVKASRFLWDGYNALRGYSEDMNRLAYMKQLRDRGASYRTQIVSARDMLNFTQSGASPVMQFVIKVAPFFNSGIQGLYRVGRPTSKARLAMSVFAMAVAEVALQAIYGDDDDWKKRSDFDRQTYYWFKVGSVAIRIPKSFELGSVGTMAGDTVQLWTNDEMTNHRFWTGVRSMVANSLRLNPTPQLLRPVLDVAMNKDFTGSAIETPGMERLPKASRIGPQTTETAKLLGGFAPAQEAVLGQDSAVSPVQIDSLIRGYFGWLGTMALTASDAAINAVSDGPPTPDKKLKDWFLVGKFAEDLPANTSRYSDVFYEQAKVIQEAYNDYHAKLKVGDRAGAREVLMENRGILSQQPKVARFEEMLSLDRSAIRRVTQDPNMDGETKRARIDALYQRMNRTLEQAARATTPPQ